MSDVGGPGENSGVCPPDRPPTTGPRSHRTGPTLLQSRPACQPRSRPDGWQQGKSAVCFSSCCEQAEISLWPILCKNPIGRALRADNLRRGGAPPLPNSLSVPRKLYSAARRSLPGCSVRTTCDPARRTQPSSENCCGKCCGLYRRGHVAPWRVMPHAEFHGSLPSKDHRFPLGARNRLENDRKRVSVGAPGRG